MRSLRTTHVQLHFNYILVPQIGVERGFFSACPMRNSSDLAVFLRRQFPDFSDETRALFLLVAENTNLLRSDFYSLHDLLELTGLLDQEQLAVVLLLLFVALDEGSPCLELSEQGLTHRLSDVTGSGDAKDTVQQILKGLRIKSYDQLIGRSTTDGNPVVLYENGNRQFLYFQKYLHHELIFWDRLKALLNADAAASDNLNAIVKEVIDKHPMQIAGKPLRLDRHQLIALGVALLQPFAVVSGGPGTGKTSFAVTLLRCLLRTGIKPERIALAAPTGRAAQRLADSLHDALQRLPNRDDAADRSLEQLESVTLHKLLSYHPGRGRFQRHKENPIPADVVIVDEASMIGLTAMSQLLLSLEPGCKLILLGDKDQLPSVEAGAVLAHLLQQAGDDAGFSPDFCGQLKNAIASIEPPASLALHPLQDHMVVLQANFRSQKQIRETAEAVNAQQTGVLDRLPALHPGQSFADLADGCWYFEMSPNTQELRTVLDHWTSVHFLSGGDGSPSFVDMVDACRLPSPSNEWTTSGSAQLDKLFAKLNRARLLTLIRETPWGCVDINRFVQHRLRVHMKRGEIAGLFAGTPILIVQNDARRELYNGDVGLTLADETGRLQVVFPRRAGYVRYDIHTLPTYELGFALTVHKSQGSEYEQVLLVVPPASGRRLLCKELIYTAITRAKKRAILYGTKQALQTAIGRRIVRESGVSQL